jgi:hypothetical protein
VKSQTHEGWRLVKESFDDGGFSGGSLERPALQWLLAAIRSRLIDVVLVRHSFGEGRAGDCAAISASRFRISTASLIRPVEIAARARSSRAGMSACRDAFACSAASARSSAIRRLTLAFVSSLAADARVAPFGGREYASA